MKIRALNVQELKAARVIYLSGRIEVLREQSRKLEVEATKLDNERAHLVQQLGYDPRRGVTKEET